MSGSSRSLSRALETVFTEDKDITNIINQYIEKHNEYTIIQQSTIINDELYKIYNEYNKPSEDIEREYKFLDILTQVCGIFNKIELDVWVHTYLKPSVDSAGFDLKFVEKSREFLKHLTTEYINSNDEKLNKLRLNYAKSIAKTILDIYLDEKVMHEKLNLKIEMDQRNNQAYHERIRFIKSNCAKLLKQFGEKHTKELCELLSDCLHIPEYKNETLILFGDFIAQQNKPEIINYQIFQDLVKIIAEDTDEVSVNSALTNLLMIIPQVAKDLGRYVSDLFLLCTRIISWAELKAIDNSSAVNSQHFGEKLIKNGVVNHFDSQHLITLLYGLFFFNITKFTQSPAEYLTKNQPQILQPKPLLPYIEDNTRTFISHILETFLLHPKVFLKEDDELATPTSWIKNNTSPEDVAISCLSLNPNIMIKPVQKKNSVSTIDKLSRSSSLAGPMYMQANGPTKQILARKLSIIPTNLVIEDDIKFKDFKFNNKLDSIPSSPESHKVKEFDPLNELLFDHEKLFTSRHNPGEIVDEKKSEITLARPLSSPTTNVDSSSLSKEFSTSDTITSGDKSQTSLPDMNGAIDFYQRELLLFKNELEFSSYMKHLNKFYYLKNSQKNIDEVPENFNRELNLIITQLREENLKINEEYIKQRNILIEKIESLQKQNADSVQELSNFKKQTELEAQNYKIMVEEIIPDKDFIIETLKTNLATAQDQEPIIETKVIKEQTDTSEFEKQIFDYKVQLQIVNEKLNNLIQENRNIENKYDEMIKQYELKLSKSKLSLNDNLSSFTINYDKKIQEFQTILIKYEKLLEEKNNKILQLSSSKPIPIHRSNSGRHESISSMNSSRNDEFSYGGNNGSGLNINDDFIYNTNHQTPAPIQQMMRKNEKMGMNSNYNSNINNINYNDSLPIMRGRGGLQKRSKKFM
ncbi:hypothetical protein KGF54_001218 [Candida jiufengensis]|uniref:uncharacterized protein n=1 Tax=Candida jiufengensis TaxID=497108 RepID=UPI002225B026|nr:uncharacterized protein KGF54_001218 [Candida jiufengensis]KAI5955716.1 hypothetical protein KGF54_001218 [Candida jiufengensis]